MGQSETHPAKTKRAHVASLWLGRYLGYPGGSPTGLALHDYGGARNRLDYCRKDDAYGRVQRRYPAEVNCNIAARHPAKKPSRLSQDAREVAGNGTATKHRSK